jgi:hypothetical protein
MVPFPTNRFLERRMAQPKREPHMLRFCFATLASVWLLTNAVLGFAETSDQPDIAGSAQLAQATPTDCNPRRQFSGNRSQGRVWNQRPRIAILTQNGDDPRVQHTRDAIAFWNDEFENMGSGFRLGPVTVEAATREDEILVARFSAAFLDREDLSRFTVPDRFAVFCGHIVVVLSNRNFVSIAGPIVPRMGLMIVGIKGNAFFPFTLPNVTPNVIAHEIGHALGLGHNMDPATLMCSRPAPCRPDLFRSDTPRFFPLTEAEKQRLLRRYPSN